MKDQLSALALHLMKHVAAATHETNTLRLVAIAAGMSRDDARDVMRVLSLAGLVECRNVQRWKLTDAGWDYVARFGLGMDMPPIPHWTRKRLASGAVGREEARGPRRTMNQAPEPVEETR